MRRLIYTILVIALLIPNTGYCIPYNENETSIQIIPINKSYDEVSKFYDGVSVVTKDGKYGVVDSNGREVLPTIYSHIYDSSEGRLVVEKNDLGTVGVFDDEGHNIVPLNYFYIYPYSEGLAAVMNNKKESYFIDKNGKIVIPNNKQIYSYDSFSNGLAAFHPKGHSNETGLIDKTGKIVVQPIVGDIFSFEDGMAEVIDEHWAQQGYMNAAGTIIKNPGYLSKMWGYSDGLMRVAKSVYNEQAQWYFDSFGYMDKDGKIVIPLIYDMVNDFKEDYAIVQKDGYYGVINKAGEEVIGLKYTASISSQQISEGYFILGNDTGSNTGKYGYVDVAGTEITGSIYDDARDFVNGLAAVKVNDKWGYINKKGDFVIEPNFDEPDRAPMYGINHPNYYDRLCFYDGVCFAYDGDQLLLLKIVPKGEPSAWAGKEVSDAIKNKLVPSDLQSQYQSNISRADFCKLLVNFLAVSENKTESEFLKSHSDIDTNKFTDTKDPYILVANALGITNGKASNMFKPYDTISRQEAAVMLRNTANLVKVKAGNSITPFSDTQSINSWAKDSVAFVSSVADKGGNNRLMSGTSNGAFNPKGFYIREQAFITINRLFYCSQN